MKKNRLVGRWLLLAIGLNFSSTYIFAEDFFSTTAAVGRSTNGLITPVNQRITSAGGAGRGQ